MPSDEAMQADFLRAAEENSYLAHWSVVAELIAAGARIITVGARGYPDILFEMGERVIAIEVKGQGDSLGRRQRIVLQALRRLERVEIIRVSGSKRAGEMTVQDLLVSLSKAASSSERKRKRKEEKQSSSTEPDDSNLD
jgi:hypothetical protein